MSCNGVWDLPRVLRRHSVWLKCSDRLIFWKKMDLFTHSTAGLWSSFLRSFWRSSYLQHRVNDMSDVLLHAGMQYACMQVSIYQSSFKNKSKMTASFKPCKGRLDNLYLCVDNHFPFTTRWTKSRKVVSFKTWGVSFVCCLLLFSTWKKIFFKGLTIDCKFFFSEGQTSKRFGLLTSLWSWSLLGNMHMHHHHHRSSSWGELDSECLEL